MDQESKVIEMFNKGMTLGQVQKVLEKDGVHITTMGLCHIRKRFRGITTDAKQLEKLVTDKRIEEKIRTGEVADRALYFGTKIMENKIMNTLERIEKGEEVSKFDFYLVNSFMKTLATLSHEITPQFETTQSQIYQNLKERYLKKDTGKEIGEDDSEIPEVESADVEIDEAVKEEIKEEIKEDASTCTSPQDAEPSSPG